MGRMEWDGVDSKIYILCETAKDLQVEIVSILLFAP